MKSDSIEDSNAARDYQPRQQREIKQNKIKHREPQKLGESQMYTRPVRPL